jgi:ribosomal protein S18 acetylase RimI-like enzyme
MPSLERRGCVAEGESLTLFAESLARADSGRGAVDLTEAPNAEWLDAMGALQRYGENERAVYRGIVGLLNLPSVFAAVRQEGRIVSAAYGVLSGSLVCFESVVTDPAWRGRGIARAMLSSILAWAAARGATASCLQVQADNAPALALYRRLGFRTELYRYHYRRARG